jgi:hypothetical protein
MRNFKRPAYVQNYLKSTDSDRENSTIIGKYLKLEIIRINKSNQNFQSGCFYIHNIHILISP